MKEKTLNKTNIKKEQRHLFIKIKFFQSFQVL